MLRVGEGGGGVCVRRMGVDGEEGFQGLSHPVWTYAILVCLYTGGTGFVPLCPVCMCGSQHQKTQKKTTSPSPNYPPTHVLS